VERRTFAELQEKKRPIGIERTGDRLMLPSTIDKCGFCEISVVYYRAGYSPDDMLIRNAWEAREVIERSKAIKCPSLAMQLAGAKKVQQVLSEPGVLEDFLLGENRPDTGFGAGRGVLTEADVQRVRDTWMGMWPMDESPMGEEGYKLATTEAERFVLKPQREGGGNNIYRNDIPKHLQDLATRPVRPGKPKPQEQYILMELINPPNGVYNWLLRGGDSTPRKAEVVSELGIYGSILYMDGKVTFNKKIGSLLRTKGKESDEGGVAIGQSAMVPGSACADIFQALAPSTALSWWRTTILVST
jgi:glutathione synthetase